MIELEKLDRKTGIKANVYPPSSAMDLIASRPMSHEAVAIKTESRIHSLNVYFSAVDNWFFLLGLFANKDHPKLTVQ
jgi:hypothetical protein